MLPRCFVAVMAASACGTVASDPIDAADAPVTYKGRLEQTAPVTFGGGPMGYCTYTMTLQQLDVELGIRASGEVTSGQVQNLNVEAIVGTCTLAPAPAVIANYSFASAMPGSGSTTLTFEGDPANKTKVALAINLSVTSSVYKAALTFHRTDLGVPLDWRVAATVTLAPK